MWTIHPLFLEMGEQFGNSTFWALAFMNMISYKNGEWKIMDRDSLRDDMVLDQAMSSLAHGYLEEWMPKIKKTFTNFSGHFWGGSINTIGETAENYDKYGIDGVHLDIGTVDKVMFDITNDFSYPIQGFVFTKEPESINRANVLEVLL